MARGFRALYEGFKGDISARAVGLDAGLNLGRSIARWFRALDEGSKKKNSVRALELIPASTWGTAEGAHSVICDSCNENAVNALCAPLYRALSTAPYHPKLPTLWAAIAS